MNKSAATLLIVTIMVLSCMATVKPANALTSQWVEKTPMLTARCNFGAATVNGTIYAIGGLAEVFNGYEHGHMGTTNVNEAYNTTTDTWVEKAPMPRPHWLDNFGIAVYGSKIYCIGGPANNVYDPAADTWEAKTPMPTSRHFLDANVVNGKIYLIGGLALEPTPWQNKMVNDPHFKLISYSSSDKNEVYDPVTDSWTEKAPLPYAVAFYSSAVVNNKIYVISGSTRDGITGFVQVYDPQTDNWSLAAPIPNPVENAAAGAVLNAASDAVCVIGGCTESHRLSGSNFNQVYFPENDSWTTATPMNSNTRALSIAVVNNTLYAIGGISDNSDFYSSAVYQYSPTELTTPHPTIQPSQSPTPPLLVIALVATVATVATVIISGAVLLWKKTKCNKVIVFKKKRTYVCLQS
jgi:N-acetylneuraminic acid mutarotase